MKIQIKGLGCLVIGMIASVILLIIKLCGVNISWWIVMLPYIVAFIWIVSCLLIVLIPMIVLFRKNKTKKGGD